MHSILRKLAIEASLSAHCPYSKLQVGAALITDKGDYYTGCNIENSSFGGTICAERVAIFSAIAARGKSAITKLYLYSEETLAPCGFCRQVLSEFAAKDLLIIIGNKAKEEKELPFSELFPLPFGPSFLKKTS